MFVHLNIHSIYSPMKGLITLNRLMKLANYYNMNTLALTDVNGMWGFIKYVQYCINNHIAPIAGTNLITKEDEVILLAENQIGYHNICRLISSLHKNSEINLIEELKLYSSGIFILSSRISTLKALKNVIPDTHLFIELRPQHEEKYIHSIAKKMKLEIIATGDVYFESKHDHRSYLILRAIEENKKLDQLNYEELKSKLHWFRSELEMVQLFPNSLDAINNSFYLSKRCKTDWKFINTIFPGSSLKENHQLNIKLKDRVYEGAKIRYETLNQKIESRIKYELNMIIQKGFANYFLIVQDIALKTKSTIGRGSAAASIVSYCLFITQVDPIKHNLKFERFIHPEREDMPDIDIDFPWDERDDILQYVFNKYGESETAMVANQVFLKPRSAIREIGKIYGLSNEEITKITKRISRHEFNSKELTKKDSYFSNINIDEKLSSIIKESKKVIGVLRYLSVHPGGIIIVPDEIQKYVPVLIAPKGIQIVEWEKDQVEDSGLLKIDLLGNRSLAVVRDTIKQINLYYKNKFISNKYLDYHQIQPVEDFKTNLLIKSGKTMGIFYIESPSMRQLLAKSCLVNFDHIVIFSSIIRPAANKYINILLERIHGKPWKLIHKDLDFLKESYGIMVYEEQVSMTIMKMTGFGYAKTESFRKTIGRNSDKKIIDFLEIEFKKVCLNRGYKSNVINEVWMMISSFIGFSFCKPHSASYTMLSFTCAYLKAHFPAEFLAAVISNQGGYYSSYAYMSEARRFGIKILQPDINRSFWYWTGYKQKIRMGFMSIRKVKKQAIEVIINERISSDFKSLDDFLLRVDLDFADAIAITNAGCFRNIEPKLTHREIAYLVAGFYLQGDEKFPLKKQLNYPELDKDEHHSLELQSFGYPLSIHPIHPYRSLISTKVIYAEEIPKYLGKSIYLLGMYITKKQTITRDNRTMIFLTLEDETDIYECVIFPKVYEMFGDILNWETFFIIKGIVEQSFDVYNIQIEKIGSLQNWIQKIKHQKSLKNWISV